MILDVLLTGGVFAALYLIATFIRDDNARPSVRDVTPDVTASTQDDDLELSWSMGTGDWR